MSSHEQEQLFDTPPGLRLRQAREALGWSAAEVADRLKMRVSRVEAIEREDLEALGAPVFARGYITGYANLVGLPAELVDEMLPREQVTATITAALPSGHNRISRRRYVLDRYARRFVYVALTASIVVPVVLLSTRDNLPDPATLLAPLDAPLSQAETSDISGQLPANEVRRVELVGPPAQGEHAVMASLTPFYTPPRIAPAPAPVPVPVVATGLVLDVSGESWVEVIGHDGSRLMHGLMQPGSTREFEPSKVARVLLGNASAVKVRLNGEDVDIEPFRRANVARFTVSSDGSLVPAGG